MLRLSQIILLLHVLSVSQTGATEIQKDFIYHIYWTGIRAGTAVLTVVKDDDHITIKTHARSSRLISIFYRVDDRAESTITPDGYPIKFTLKVRQGRHRRDKMTLFQRLGDGRWRILFYNILDHEEEQYISDTPAYDPLSAFYEMSRWSLSVGRSEFINIFDNKKFYRTEVKVLRKERIRVPAGEFETIVVKPLLKSEGIFLKTGEIYIWVTDDRVKLPVKLKSRAVIGSFTAMLVEGNL